MYAIRKINNNVVFCLDSAGRELIAMGKGIGFGEIPREISLADIERTFYDVDESHAAVMKDLPQDVVTFSADLVDIAKNELDYDLSPNVTLSLADHISFTIERCRKNIRVKMPLAYDVEHLYPKEYRLAKHAIKRLSHEYRIYVPDTEAIGIAMIYINARLEGTKNAAEMIDHAEVTEKVVKIIEQQFRTILDKESFHYCRFATHLEYLYNRLENKDTLSTGNSSMYQSLVEQYPEVSSCTDRIAVMLEGIWKEKLTDEEKLYLLLHVNRVCAKEGLQKPE